MIRAYQLPEVDIRSYGAQPGGKCTVAIQTAIDACSSAGGGQVVIAGGTYHSGTIFLKTGVYLRVDAGAKLIASGDPDDYSKDVLYTRYLHEEYMDRAFIFAEDVSDIGIIGDGEINGNGAAFHNEHDRRAFRPMLCRLLRCHGVTLHGIHVCDPGSWTFAILDCENVEATSVSIRSIVNLNGDGLDFDGCRNVRVWGCDLFCSDDAICVQCHGAKYAASDILIENCHIATYCAGIRIGLKSIGDIDGVVIRGCTFENVWREGLKIEACEGGAIRNITLEDCVMRDTRRPVYCVLDNEVYSKDIDGIPEIGELENITIRNVSVIDSVMLKTDHFVNWSGEIAIQGCPVFGGMRFDAAEGHPIRNVLLEKVDYRALGGIRLSDIPAEYPPLVDRRLRPDVKFRATVYTPAWNRATHLDARNVEGLTLRDTNFTLLYEDERPDCVFDDCKGVVRE